VEPSTDPIASARAAGLRYVSDQQPGIRRQRTGRGFSYLGVDGQRIRAAEELRRIEMLAIPPAWMEVWICPQPNGHLQATGRDAKGRKQYRYHPQWRAVRDTTKYDRMILFGEKLPTIRAQVTQDLARPGLPREKVLAVVVRLLETTLIRIGNKEYARDNHSFGLTTMRDRHVEISGATLQFQFRGKSGKQHTLGIKDRRLARIVKRCRDLPGYELFQYVDADGQRQTIDAADVNDYLRYISGEDFTAKDIRTWTGTVLAVCALCEFEGCTSATQARKNVAQAVKSVAEQLGNTEAICRKYYVHPAVISAYLEGTLPNGLLSYATQGSTPSHADGLYPEEVVVLEFLKQL
jgi:DNA topoisomerase-1